METMEFVIDETFKGAFPEPVPAHLALPQWFKDDPTRVNNGRVPGSPKGSTYKRCVPFVDIMRTGYIIPLWADLAFSYTSCTCGEEGCPKFVPSVAPPKMPPYNYPSTEMIEHRNWDSWGNIPELKDSIKGSSMAFCNPWLIKTPPGYSTLITSPFNDESRPHPAIKTLTGLVNTDTYRNQITFFFHIKYPFEGVIKQGTPLVQLIPIKREEWKHEISYMKCQDGDETWLEMQQERNALSTTFEDSYRKRHGCPVNFI